MARPSFHDLAYSARVIKRKKRLVRALLELGCDPRATLRGIEKRAAQDLERVNAQARPFIASGASLGRINGRDA
ncbi:MAG: hypothetical protein KQI62_02140 [Deltaproteobacteria bacterium]|nr:hypothetical protein [Deltaproteobacteria bacterium]